MVHSNGTRFESHRFRIDRTGRTKYSGRSGDFLRVSAGGEHAARRAMPTRRALARSSGTTESSQTGSFERLWVPLVIGDVGGQSVVVRSAMLPCWSAAGTSTVLRSLVKQPPTTVIGLTSLGHSGKSLAAVGETRRRWITIPTVDEE